MKADDKKIAEATSEEIEAAFAYLSNDPGRSAFEYAPQEGEATEQEINEVFKSVKI